MNSPRQHAYPILAKDQKFIFAYAMSFAQQANRSFRGAKLTPGGKAWITSAFDPFHDYEHKLSGYPDSDSSNTVVSMQQYQMDVSAPTPNAVWDCHVFNGQQLKQILTDVMTWNTLDHKYERQQSYPSSFLNVFSSAQGNYNFPTPSSVPTTVHCLPGDGVDDLTTGVCRVIAAGFEIINTTSDLYKQGSLTAYRQSGASCSTFLPVEVTNGSGTSGVVSVMADQVAGPPENVDQCNSMRSTRTWAAAEGAYVPITFSKIDNPLVPYSHKSLVKYVTDTDNGTIHISEVGISNDTFIAANCPRMKIAPVNTSGVFLTGLHPQAVITIKLRVYVERAPTHIDSLLAPLAGPSAAYDARALELYSSVMSRMPVAVDFKSNGLGDWWRSILKVVSQVAGPIGTVVSAFNPVVGGLIKHVGTAAGSSFSGKPSNLAKTEAQKPKEKRKK